MTFDILLQGGDKLKDAYYAFQELADRNNSTPLLLNGQAVAYMGQAKYDDAETVLQEAMDKVRETGKSLVVWGEGIRTLLVDNFNGIWYGAQTRNSVIGNLGVSWFLYLASLFVNEFGKFQFQYCFLY